ncbi:MAG: ion channel [Tetrasphaera sp.]
MILIPFFGSERRPVFSVMGLILLVLAIATVRNTPGLPWISGLIALPALCLEVWGLLDSSAEAARISADGLLAGFYFYVGYALIAYVFADHWVTKDELFAVGAAFTVFAWAFAYVYLLVQQVWPGSFQSQSPDEILTFHELLYMSVACFTSVGLSDVAPVLPHARSVVMVEQLGGVLYVAMVISRLVALTAMRRL